MKYYNLGTDIRENIWNKSGEKRNFVLLFFSSIFLYITSQVQISQSVYVDMLRRFIFLKYYMYFQEKCRN